MSASLWTSGKKRQSPEVFLEEARTGQPGRGFSQEAGLLERVWVLCGKAAVLALQPPGRLGSFIPLVEVERRCS